ncbi:hypothetical protein [Actinoplanes derwentensis]|uniref:Ig-like domain-containing protein n=1 Tax=Actinoplanes derwentensis TaxID=113562 RepID=A0A1H2CXF0_9ACTN|nr:hypothetical protein [Actinoplanes derwentensis]GID82836.1 hypothetical protein Ade03nite_17600 [Actinoplanes derwentensis]SDT75175.1 hypothetical protein SAMN04489716_7217 [Actinoplanes derwentensis]
MLRRWGSALLGGLLILTLFPGAARAADDDTTACVDISDQGISAGPHHGSIAAEGEPDCLRLPSPEGARIRVLVSYPSALTPEVTWQVHNADGRIACAASGCTLTGPGPYRVLVGGDRAVADYAIAVQRLDQNPTCDTLPQGRFGDVEGVTFGLSADTFVRCWTVPAGAHATRETLSFTRLGTAWAGGIALAVHDAAGALVCGNTETRLNYRYQDDIFHCRFTAGAAYTVIAVSNRTDGQYRINRRDATGAGCQAPATTGFGGRASAGTVAATDDIHCYRFSAAAGDHYWINVRGGHGWVTDSTGAIECSSLPCRVTGRTGYQVLATATAGATPIRVDTWNLGTGSGVPASCARQLSSAPGFGPIDGELTADRTAVCVALPSSSYSSFHVRLSGDPDVFHLAVADSGTGVGECIDYTTVRECGRWADDAAETLLIFTPATATDRLTFRAETTCSSEPCFPDPYTLSSLLSADASNHAPGPMWIVGKSLDVTDQISLTRAGHTTVPAVVRHLTADRTQLTVDVDFTRLAAGTWNVTGTSTFRPGQSTLTGALTVHGPAPTAGTPSISGTVRVGAVVKAATGKWDPVPSFTYQWTANGTAIKGATGASYSIPASLRGKRLAVRVTGKHPHYVQVTTASVTVGYGVAPRATTRPKIKGTARAGKTVKVTAGVWSPKATSYRYEWRVAGKLVATTASLKLKKTWTGKKLTLTVIAKRTGHLDGRAAATTVKIRK